MLSCDYDIHNNTNQWGRDIFEQVMGRSIRIPQGTCKKKRKARIEPRTRNEGRHVVWQ